MFGVSRPSSVVTAGWDGRRRPQRTWDTAVGRVNDRASLAENRACLRRFGILLIQPDRSRSSAALRSCWRVVRSKRRAGTVTGPTHPALRAKFHRRRDGGGRRVNRRPDRGPARSACSVCELAVAEVAAAICSSSITGGGAGSALCARASPRRGAGNRRDVAAAASRAVSMCRVHAEWTANIFCPRESRIPSLGTSRAASR